MAGKSYTCDEAVELAGNGRYQYMLLAACSVINNAVALDMFGFSITVAAANCDLNLGVTEMGVLASAPFAGVVFAGPWGYYADTRGRRRTILCSTGFGFLFAVLSSISPNWQLMLISKIVACSFSTASYTVTMTILGECTGEKVRSQYLFIMYSINLLSDFFSFSLAYFILPLQFSLHIPLLNINYRPWRLFTLFLAIPMSIGGMMIAYLEESPKFLASRGNNKKALDVLKIIYACNGGRKEEYPVEHLSSTEDVGSGINDSFLDSVLKQTVPIFKRPLKWRTLQLFYLMGISTSTNNAFSMWYPLIVSVFFDSLRGGWNTERTFCQRVFTDSNSSMTHGISENEDYECNDRISNHAIISGVIYGIFFFVVTIASSKFAAKPRLVLMSWLAISAVSGALVDLRNPAASIIFFVLLQTSIVGVPSVAAYCVDLYPTAYRGLVTSLAMMMGRLFSLIGVNIIGAFIPRYCSMTFYVWAVLVFTAIVVSSFLPPDKKI